MFKRRSDSDVLVLTLQALGIGSVLLVLVFLAAYGVTRWVSSSGAEASPLPEKAARPPELVNGVDAPTKFPPLVVVPDKFKEELKDDIEKALQPSGLRAMEDRGLEGADAPLMPANKPSATRRGQRQPRGKPVVKATGEAAAGAKPPPSRPSSPSVSSEDWQEEETGPPLDPREAAWLEKKSNMIGARQRRASSALQEIGGQGGR